MQYNLFNMTGCMHFEAGFVSTNNSPDSLDPNSGRKPRGRNLEMLTCILIFLFGVFVSGLTNAEPVTEPQDRFQPTWESLATYNEAPAWLKDAKFGIYFHWGVYSVPAFGDEWYPHWMHFPDRKEFAHHVETYGPHAEFGYHDFVPMFKAEDFDPADWAELFRRAGARFAGGVAEHHDGFAMWDSGVTPWNAMDKGPKRDVIGELAQEIHARGMKLVTTFHHARNLQRHEADTGSWNSHYPFFEGMPTTSDDPELKLLYGNVPEPEWLENIWLAKVEEVTRKYRPDIVYFDSWLDMIPESYRLRMCADYLNKAAQWGTDVVIVHKQDDLPLDVSIEDLEKSRKNELGDRLWMTDETISYGSWSHTTDLRIKQASDLLHVLIDVVSKNGVLMLNISPMASGEIPNDQRNVLLSMGDWLDKYGEAIFGTRPWKTYGEGPTNQPEGKFENHQAFLEVKYSGRDVRFTTREGVVYAIFLGDPDRDMTLESFAGSTIDIQNISLLGSEHQVVWSAGQSGLQISLPARLPNDIAPVLKIRLKSR